MAPEASASVIKFGSERFNLQMYKFAQNTVFDVLSEWLVSDLINLKPTRLSV